jgi:DNA helicase HerA-like ATPase
MVTLEQAGAARFFGEPEFDIDDLLRTTPEGAGFVSLLELSDVMDQPRLFSTFMLWMLAQLYEGLPEVGDLPKPKLVFFFDEAHLLFDDASEALMEQVERTARLIRSKGVGVYFVTQAPTDVPSSILGQLGNRVQHALRAFTPEDADNLRKTARTFPMTDFYDVEETLTSLGIGEALVTVLSPRGVPTPLAATLLLPPDSLMAALPPDEVEARVAASPLAAKYGAAVDRDSAHEMITARLEAAKAAVAAAAGGAAAGAAGAGSTALDEKAIKARQKELERARKEAEREAKAQVRAEAAAERERDRTMREAMKATSRVVTSKAGQDLLRGVLGTLFGGGRSR